MHALYNVNLRTLSRTRKNKRVMSRLVFFSIEILSLTVQNLLYNFNSIINLHMSRASLTDVVNDPSELDTNHV